MGTYILCQTKRAQTPYFIGNISRNIYSLEELCYYLYHNLYLIDQSIMNEELCSWLEKELGLNTLASKLRPFLGKFADEAEFIYPIFKEINYLTYQEMKELNGRIRRLNEESPENRTKKKGDSMVKNGMYAKAIQVYQNLLKEMLEKESGSKENEQEEEQARENLLAATWHNLGSAYACLFQFSKALTCFENEYAMSKSAESQISCFLCYHEMKTPIEFSSLLEEQHVSTEIREEIKRRLEQFGRIPEVEVYPRDVDEWIKRLAEEYHRSTQS